MTWTSSAIPAAETAARGRNRPYLIGTHVGDGMRPIWTSDTGAHTDTDESAPGAPAVRAVDRTGAEETVPGGVTDTEWVLSLGPLSARAAAQGLDRLVLLSNLGTVGVSILGGIQAFVEGAEDAAYSTGLVELHSFTVTQDRWVDGFAARWVCDPGDYLRIRFSAGQVFRPRVREAWIGRTRQMTAGHILSGRDPFGLASSLDVSDGGAAVAVREQALGANAVPMALRLSTADEVTLARAWWRAIDYGCAPFVFHPRPAESQHDARILTTEVRKLDLPRIDGLYERVLEQPWRELPPFRATEV